MGVFTASFVIKKGADPMERKLPNGQSLIIRPFQEQDFPAIQALNEKEGWSNLVKRDGATKEAWRNSTVAYVAVANDEIIGYVRGLTDAQITLYICELLVGEDFRGMKIGQTLLRHVHRLYPETRMELLASASSRSFYEHLGFRSFYGFRKTFGE